jgi:hypothetical protein
MVRLPVTPTSDIKSGIVTEKVFEQEPRGYRVVWINWDSDFRSTDLQIGDLITGVDGKKYENIHDGNVSPLAVGQHLESVHWQRAGAKDGQEITLDILRLQEKPLQIKGKLLYEKLYSMDDGRRSLSPGGPPTLSNDGFSGPWSMWYENFVKKSSYILDFVWERWGSLVTKKELEEHEGLKPRIDYLAKNYPGPFADSVVADWNRVKQYLLGPKIDPKSVDLEYRGIGEARIQLARDAAAKSYQAFLAEMSNELIQPFPASEPDERDKVVGKVVELPWITYRNIINDLGRSYAVMGSTHEGFYFADVNSPEMTAFFGTWFRFKGNVNPGLTERYRIVGRILDDPRMLTFQRQPVKGLMVRALGVSSGDGELFVDLRNVKAANDVAKFAGEDQLASNAYSRQIPDDATPAQVIEAMIHAIKFADEEGWKKLFASWRVFTKGDMTIVDSSYNPAPVALQRDWEFSRKLVNDKVHDARVSRATPIRVLTHGGSNPKVEQVTVYIYHVGQVAGQYMAYSDIEVKRVWNLQRINGGPWRIVESQHL